MKLSFKGLTTAATVLAAALGLNLLGPHRAYAVPGNLALPGESDLGVTILSPDPNLPLNGTRPVEISAFYQGTPGNQIISVDLILDGVKAAGKTLEVPETRGVVSFLVDSSQLSAGTHKIVVRATAADQEVKSARSAFTFGAPSGDAQLSAPGLRLPAPPASPSGPTAPSGDAPTLQMVNPAEDGKTVRGMVTLHVKATDPSGKAPYVSLFIDKTFKTLRNFAPYEFEWDTTAYPNGLHTIEAYGYNDSPNVGHSQTLHLYVNNPGGETHIRRDLQDIPKTVKPAISAPVTQAPIVKRAAAAPRKSVGRPLPLRRPDLLTTEAPVVSPTPTRAISTHEILRQIARAGHRSLQFGPLNFMAELSSQFVTDKPASQSIAPAAPTASKTLKLVPTRGFKPLPTVSSAGVAVPIPTADPGDAQLATAPIGRRTSGKMARLQRLAALQMPGSDLASPFLAAPRIRPLSTVPEFKIASYQAEMHFAHAQTRSTQTVLKPMLKMHPMRVHFPANLGSLLRSVGQTSLLFNHTTVKLDRPISARGNVVFGPLRQIFEQGGGSLTWQSRTGTVRAKNATRDIVLTIGNSQALVNAKTVMLDGKPYLLTGRTMVPLSFVSIALDADVQYDAATGHLLVTSRK